MVNIMYNFTNTCMLVHTHSPTLDTIIHDDKNSRILN